MTTITARRLSRIALAAALTGAAPAALAQSFAVTPSPPSAPPIANAATMYVASSVRFDVTNARAGTTINRIDFELPKFWTATGGLGPAGWTLVDVSEHNNNTVVSFAVATCGQGGLANGVTGTFRLDFTPNENPGAAADTTYSFASITPSDPCGSTGGWTTPGLNVLPVKVLSLTASAAPMAGAPPLATTVTFAVTNRSSGTLTVTAPTPTVTPAAGATFTGCTPATRSVAAGASDTFACTYTLNPASPTSYTVAATVGSSPPGSSAVGTAAGPIAVGSATATFAFDHLAAATGDLVRATLTVTNQGGTTTTITPPTYAQLSLTNLSPSAGTTDPAPATGVPSGASRSFVYVLTVTGAPGASYVASGTAAVGAGASNLAVTPVGTVNSFMTTWTPAIRKTGAPAPYQFTVAVKNLSSTSIARIDVVNPQNGTFTGLASLSFTGLTSVAKTTSGATDTLQYSGTVAQNATATMAFGFTAIPAPATTTSYPFQVQVFGQTSGGGTTVFPIGSRDVSVAITAALPDVGNLSLLSSPSGQTLYWTNTSDANGVHDGVVIFRSVAPAVPITPVDGTDYTGSPTVLYFDKLASSVSSRVDPQAGAYNYRVCNHDAGFIYSSCSSGFWNGAGYIDSVTLPAGVSWAHSFGLPVDGYPGVLRGHVAVASNAPSLGVVAASTGQRSFAPVKLTGLPNVGTPAAPVSSGAASLAFGADTSGGVFAVDLAAGATPPGWSASKPGEAFQGGIAGVLQQYVGAAYRASYSTDVLLLGSSTTGNLLGIDARTGATLWTRAPTTTGARIRTQPHYDYGTNRLYVSYDGGGGVVAYGGIGSGSAPGTPLWSLPGGSYLTPCTFGSGAGQIACVATDGALHVLDAATGADLLNGPTGYSTGIADALTLWPVGDGYVVSNATSIKRLVISGASVTATYVHSGTSLSPLLVSAGDGFVYVADSDLRVHKLLLSNLGDTGLSRALPVAGASPTLAPPVMDVADSLLLLGSSDGRLWAVPVF